MDSSDVSSLVGCPETCGADDDQWFRKKTPSKDCGWVAEKVDTRCKNKVMDSSDVSSLVGCPETCGGCLEDVEEQDVCVDDSSWHYATDDDKGCGWVSMNSDRCVRMGADDRDAWEACPETCGGCQ